MRIDFDERPDSVRSWIFAALAAIAMIFTFGTAFSYGVFLGPFSEAFGISTVGLSTIFAIMLFALYIGAGVVSVFASRLSSRTVVLVCAGLTGMLAPSLYAVDTYLGLVVVFALLGLTIGLVYVTLAAVVPRWFDQQRGAATGLIFVGNGLGLLIMPPTWQFTLERLSVPGAFFTLIGASAASFALAGAIAKRPGWVEHSAGSARELIEWVSGLFFTRTFQLLFVGIGLSFTWYVLVTSYAVELFSTRGLSPTLAAIAFGLIGGVSLLSRIASGVLADTIGCRRTFLASLGCAALGTVLLFFPSSPIQTVSIFFMGLGLGGIATLYIPLLMQTYSPERDTAIIGIFNVAIGVFSLTGPPVSALLIARSGSFTATIALTIVSVLVAIVSIVRATDG